MFFRPGTTRIPFKTGKRAHKRSSAAQRIELDPANDPHARAAAEAYADSCASDMPWLAEWLREPDYAHAAWEHVRLHLDAALTAHLRSKDNSDDDVVVLNGAQV